MKICVNIASLIIFIIYSMFAYQIYFWLIHLQYRIFFTLLGSFSATKRLSLVSTDKPQGESKWQFSIKRRNCSFCCMMWIQLLLLSAVRIRLWLSVVMPVGVNGFSFVRNVYLKRNFRFWLTTTTALASRSDTQISRFLFSVMYLMQPDKIERFSIVIVLDTLFFVGVGVTDNFRLF